MFVVDVAAFEAGSCAEAKLEWWVIEPVETDVVACVAFQKECCMELADAESYYKCDWWWNRLS